ncbi:helix-turn-helix domain-containing protein [Streptomyces rochei]|uniref:helix-turn-helix domain-containing protein n=1 Tax=Streptomyces rochei TaxID=1928 RepID=UPI004063AB98
MTAPVQTGPSPSGSGPVPPLDLEEYLADIGDRIRAERQARSWSQDQLAARASMNRRTIRSLENGIGTLRAFAQACAGLQVGMAHLLSDQWRLPARHPSLTVRQAEVLRVVADGRPLSAAAPVLGMTPEGLASMLSGIYRRLGVADVARDQRRQAAVRVASTHGLFDAA